MKKILILLLFFCAVGVIPTTAQDLPEHKQIAYADEQNETDPVLRFEQRRENPNELSIRFAGYDLLFEKDADNKSPHHKRRLIKPYGGRIGVVEVGFNGWNNLGYSMYPANLDGFMDLNMWKSFHLTVNVFTFSTSFTRNNVLGLTMGIGLTSNDYTFETTSRFVKEDGMILPVYPDHDLKKSKLHTFALHIPLVIEVNPTRQFFISAGGYADLLIKSHLKSKFPKEKLHSPYTNFIQAGITARVGFRNVYLFGNYSLTDVFKKGKGPTANPYTFGLGFGF